MRPPLQELRPRLADLAPHHLEAMVALERACHPVPWSRAMLADELERPDAVNLGAWDTEGSLVGMLLAAGLADAWHVLDVAVAPDSRRQGLASRMLEELFQRTARRIERAHTLEVRPSNPGAVSLYERQGFVPAGRRPGYYVDGEDALVMWRPPEAVVLARARGEQVEWEPPT